MEDDQVELAFPEFESAPAQKMARLQKSGCKSLSWTLSAIEGWKKTSAKAVVCGEISRDLFMGDTYSARYESH